MNARLSGLSRLECLLRTAADWLRATFHDWRTLQLSSALPLGTSRLASCGVARAYCRRAFENSFGLLPSRVSAVCIIALLAACATVPEQKIVSSVTSLPPVQVPVPVRCVKEVPPMPTSTVDPNAPVLARYYQMRALLAEQDEALIRHHAALLACAEPKP